MALPVAPITSTVPSISGATGFLAEDRESLATARRISSGWVLVAVAITKASTPEHCFHEPAVAQNGFARRRRTRETGPNGVTITVSTQSRWAESAGMERPDALTLTSPMRRRKKNPGES
jgi:hypothetical protein